MYFSLLGNFFLKKPISRLVKIKLGVIICSCKKTTAKKNNKYTTAPSRNLL